ncbi:MAG TPA: FAD-binding protein [Firmicutes bacterium]|nr:FAD-binding protein [Bacillota bacterium]
MALPEKTAFGILDANSVGKFKDYPDVESGDTPEELAEKIGVDPEGLAETIAKYIKYYDNGYDEDFGRTDMRCRLDTPPYYAVPVFPGAHNTHGGITVDMKAQVLDTAGQPIPGLYAAGDVADVKLFGAEALTAAYVYGKIAAESIIEYLN